MYLPSSRMAKRRPMFWLLASPKRWAPRPLKRKPTAGAPFWSWLLKALTRSSPETSWRRSTRIGGRPAVELVTTCVPGGAAPPTTELSGRSLTIWKVSLAVRPITAFSFSGSLSPGASTTMRSVPCLRMEGSRVPSASIRRRMISMVRSTARASFTTAQFDAGLSIRC